MDLPGPIHDFLLVFLGSGLLLGGIGVVLLQFGVFIFSYFDWMKLSDGIIHL